MMSEEQNRLAMTKPSIGDFWTEMIFVPYFIVVDVDPSNDEYTVLCAFDHKGAKNARATKDDHYYFDYTKHSIVNKEWIEDLVQYSSKTGFVADVRNNKKTLCLVQEWREANGRTEDDWLSWMMDFYGMKV